MKEEKEFYSIGRGSLNLNGKFYYGLNYAITDFMRSLEEENKSLQSQLKAKEEVIKEAINYIDDNTYYKDHKGHINIDDLYIILQKRSDKE